MAATPTKSLATPERSSLIFLSCSSIFLVSSDLTASVCFVTSALIALPKSLPAASTDLSSAVAEAETIPPTNNAIAVRFKISHFIKIILFG